MVKLQFKKYVALCRYQEATFQACVQSVHRAKHGDLQLSWRFLLCFAFLVEMQNFAHKQW